MGNATLTDWVTKAIAESRRSDLKFSSVHLDYLDDVEMPHAAEAVAGLLYRVVGEFDLMRGEGLARLAWPLGMVEDLDISAPEALTWQPPDIEPPSLYYFEVEHWTAPTDREEYRRPWSLADLRAVGVDSVYACGRSMSDRARGWEFSRTLWLSLPRGT